MSRKSFALAIVIIFLLVGLVGAGGFVLVKHEPNFYKRGDIPQGPERERIADSVESEIINRLFDGIKNERTTWQANFREDHLNAWFAEGLLKKWFSDSPWSESISDLRIS